MNFKVTFTENQIKTLAGLLDVAVKSIGIRATNQDVIDVVRAVESAEPVQQPVKADEPASNSGAPAQPELRIVQPGGTA